MGEVGGALGGVAGGLFHEVLGEEGGAVGVDVLLQPSEERGGVGFLEGGGDGVVLHGGGEELGGIEVAEGVGWEVAEASHGPMDVLQAAFGVGGWGHLEEVFEVTVPSGGHVFDLEVAVEELAFEGEAEEDVEVVGGFVGFDADEGVLRAVGSEEELVEVEFLEMGEKFLARAGATFPRRGGSGRRGFPRGGTGIRGCRGRRSRR